MFVQAKDGMRHLNVTGVQTCALPIFIALCRQNMDIPGVLVEGLGVILELPRNIAAAVCTFEIRYRQKLLRSEESRVGKRHRYGARINSLRNHKRQVQGMGRTVK